MANRKALDEPHVACIPKSATQELENMDRRDSPPNSGNKSRASNANNGTPPPPMSGDRINIQDFSLLAQFAAAAGRDLDQAYPSMISHNTYPSLNPSPGSYENLLQHNSVLPPQLLSPDFPWNPLPPHQSQASGSRYTPHPATSNTSSQPYLNFPSTTAPDTTNSWGQQTQSAFGTRAVGSPEVEQTEAEHNAIADEKRRRSTAASARFRIKKKNKTTTLERSVSDLSGRAEELEREATDLRRENNWLKEIVMLKGSQFTTNSLAHQQAATLATGMVPEPDDEQPRSEPSIDGSSDEEERVPENSKGKARAKSKKT